MVATIVDCDALGVGCLDDIGDAVVGPPVTFNGAADMEMEVAQTRADPPETAESWGRGIRDLLQQKFQLVMYLLKSDLRLHLTAGRVAWKIANKMLVKSFWDAGSPTSVNGVVVTLIVATHR